MALIKCKECNRDMSDTLDACPHCGFKIQKKQEEPVKPLKINKEKRLAPNHTRCIKCGEDYWKGLSECPFCNTKQESSNSNNNEKKSNGLIIAVSIISVFLLFAFFSNENKTTEVKNKPAVIKDHYNIGERGPSGGWIFYDKGNSNGGWRYLEAAPGDLQGRINWSNGRAVKLGITSSRIGSGKKNTSKLVQALGKGSYAAKLCTNYNGGNKNDWFLPSKEELNLMYKNLHLRGLGNFPGEIYWSSTEYNFERAWIQDFSTGMQYQGIKNIYEESLGDISVDTFIRPIRSF